MEKTKAWDATLRALTHLGPAAIDGLLLDNFKFDQELVGKVQSIQRDADIVHKVFYHGKPMALHIEFQTYNDATMPDRLLMYNVLLTQAHNLPVLSCVIYLLADGRVQPSPLERTLPDGEAVLTFHFKSIEIGQLFAEDLIKQGDEILLALVPLTRDGAQRDVLESVFQELERRKVQAENDERLSEIELIMFNIASYSLEKKNSIVDLEWLKRSFQKMFELEDTVIYKEMTRMAEEKGLERGLERGLEQGRIDASRHILQLFVQNRFPALVTLAQEKASLIDAPEILDVMIISIGSAQTEEDARAILQRA